MTTVQRPRHTPRARADSLSPDSKSARTRARILDAAAAVLSDKGFAGMRMSDVADYADMHVPGIYYYFPSREDLVEEVMSAGLAAMSENLTEVLSATPDGTPSMERIMIAVEAHLRHELELSAYTTASIRNGGQLPPELRERHRQEEIRYGAIWRDLITNAVDDGEARADLDVFVTQMLVLGALNFAAEWWSPKRRSLEVLVEQTQAFVRQALT